ncbi:MAG TPA: RNA polymerase sigma factor [Candidatus Sulfotelmatobacter sp.]|nr:RNA polymerase sigma factor [Candidatus Sulfotelmatobacter sp.]
MNAVAQTYREHRARLRAVAYHVLGEVDAADDCVHAVFTRLLGAPDAYRPERGALLPFLITCVRNEAFDQLRREGRRRAREERVAREAPLIDEGPSVDPIEAARVRAALQRLPPEQRDALVRAYYGNQTQSEIARACDLPLGTVKGRVSLGLRRLAAELVR